jgi:PilZ domain
MYLEVEDERRRHSRFECAGTALLYRSPGATADTAKILDISLGGCLIELAEPKYVPLGSAVELSFVVRQLAFRVCATVKISRSAKVFGLQFGTMGARTKYDLTELMDELQESSQSISGGRVLVSR